MGLIDKILQWINTPSDIYGLSRDYLLVMCCGFLFMVETPLFFLVISSILNVGMDLAFIAVFHTSILPDLFGCCTCAGKSAVAVSIANVYFRSADTCCIKLCEDIYMDRQHLLSATWMYFPFQGNIAGKRACLVSDDWRDRGTNLQNRDFTDRIGIP